MSKKGKIVFFIGTTAEYIKLFTVIEEIKKSGSEYIVIASGQNDISKTDIAKKCNLHIDLELSKESDIKKSAVGLFSWFFKTKSKAPKQIKFAFPDVDFKKSIFVVHGDTISTVMDAFVGKKLGAKVAHVEAGLRSHHWLTPFPEEIDRHIVSKKADISFAPGETAVNNLSKSKGLVVNTEYNTIIDALDFSREIECKNDKVNEIYHKNYCVCVFHRQENLMNHKLLNEFIDNLISISQNREAVLILHEITKREITRINRMEELKSCNNVVLLNRVEYFDFMKLLDKAQYVITDGGSNQEELAYMGKPTLILRTATERNDGLGENAILFNGDTSLMKSFDDVYEKYEREAVSPKILPSKIISDTLINNEQNLNNKDI